MKQTNESPLRKAVLPLAATAVAIGAFLGLPKIKALAAAQELRVMPRANVVPPAARLAIIQPPRVNPSAAKLVAITDQAMTDQALAERIFSDPEAVAARYELTDHEKLVLRHMTREQFEIARADAARISAERLATPGARRFPPSATDPQLISSRMVVGRALLAAVGRSYLEAANAHACCPWGKAIELGASPSRVFYDEVFKAPASVNLPQPSLEVVRPDRG